MGDPSNDALLNGRQCAESIGITYNSFAKWKVKPAASGKSREKLYALKDVLLAYRERCRRELEREIKAELAKGQAEEEPVTPAQIKLDLEKEKLRLTAAQADHQELKNEVARHEVAPFDFITFVLGKAANEIAGVMDSMPVECMRKLSLSNQDVEKVRGITALAAGSIANLGDEAWLELALDEFIAETD